MKCEVMNEKKLKGKCEGCGNSPRVLTRIESGQNVCVTCLREIRGPRRSKRLATPSQIAHLREQGYVAPDNLTVTEYRRLHTMTVLRARGIAYSPTARLRELERQRFLCQPPTGRQRDWALSLGLQYSDQITHAEMSDILDDAYNVHDDVSTDTQHGLAANWQLGIPHSATRYEAAGVLFAFLTARAWVYSVCRHLVRAEWRLHSQSRLSVEIVNSVARAITQNPEILAAIKDKKSESPKSSDMWDAWYYISERTTQETPFRYAEMLIQQHFGPFLTR
jgi:hypothetical protein